MSPTACRASGALSTAVLLVLGLMALLAAPATAQELRDFEEIQASDVVITPDASGRSAVLTVATTIDVACSVVYGTDASFGRIAVDSDMDGGAHADHSPVLGGLEPDSEYLYRLQGTAADGSLYVSELLRFRTPPAPAGAPVNLAQEATVTGVSSVFSDAFAATNAFDGDPTTAWSSAGDGDDAWVEIDLGSSRAIAAVEFRTRSMSDGSSVTETFALSADGMDVGTFEADTTVELELTAQVLRFDVVSSSGGNTGAIEITVLAEDASAP